MYCFPYSPHHTVHPARVDLPADCWTSGRRWKLCSSDWRERKSYCCHRNHGKLGFHSFWILCTLLADDENEDIKATYQGFTVQTELICQVFNEAPCYIYWHTTPALTVVIQEYFTCCDWWFFFLFPSQTHDHSICIRPPLPAFNVTSQNATFQLNGSFVSSFVVFLKLLKVSERLFCLI